MAELSSAQTQQLIDQQCDAFERLWRDGDRPDLREFLPRVPSATQRELFGELLALELELRFRSGDEPDITTYQDRFPDYTAELEPIFSELRAWAQTTTAMRPARREGKPAAQDTDGQARETDQQLGVAGAERSGGSAALSVEPVQRIGRYRVLGELGRGGMGTVYLALDEQLDRQVAIKVPHARLVADADQAEAFLAEARLVARLDHPHIVSVYDIGSAEGYPCYTVSKYIEGSDLSTHVSGNVLDHRTAADLVAIVADALDWAHQRGLVHRDIKPGNILIGEDGHPYLVDFGLALSEDRIGMGSPYVGTPAYMSPEQARGEGHRVDGRSDIFSLGVVFYELLVGRQPWLGGSHADLLEQIINYEPKPLRQHDQRISVELERICQKAMSKRASDRYSIAKDLADDLRCFLGPHDVQSSTNGSVADEAVFDSTDVASLAAPPLGSGSNPSLYRYPATIVPKGLRSFDAHDADFFLELLPGPRDRSGLPDSLRFWKARIEETDRDHTFSVGLIYGPSGCGKSSLVKAGLLPRLAEHVLPVYVESTADRTEMRLRRGLRKQCPDVKDHYKLPETIAALRRGEGIPREKKVVVILDQFEQWLHAHEEYDSTELVQAIRQCDGGKVQCVIMVRDDFWMAVTRFLRQLEVQLLQDQNLASVDLFPARHARKVLSAFGQAFGALPADPSQISAEQQDFLQQSITDLSENGQVVCVRLALFAEMMQDRKWTRETLNQVGGTRGLGETFLEHTFSSRSASPEHRFHQAAARAVLRALLPESGTSIKGNMLSRRELRELSGYAENSPDFDKLIRILDGETRLITPTDPAGNGHDPDSGSHGAAGEKYYQLTHDYLVPSLRDWLTRKQKETSVGRAELRLAERLSLWNAKPENRYLPSWWEYLNIRCLTDRQRWTSPQRNMMARAARVHGARWGTALLVLLTIGVAIQQLVGAGKRRELTARLQTTVSALNTSRGIILPPLRVLREFPADAVTAELRRQFDSTENQRKLPLAYALAELGDVRLEFLISQIQRASPFEVDNLVAALSKSRIEAVAALKSASRSAASQKEWRYQARLGMLLLHMGVPAAAREMCQLRPNPIRRTWFIEACSTWHGDLSKLAQLADECHDGPLRAALALAVGQVPVADVSPDAKRAWSSLLAKWYTSATDALTHSTAGWTLSRWELSRPRIDPATRPPAESQWCMNSLGMTLATIPAGQFVRQDLKAAEPTNQTVTVTRPFLLATHEVTLKQFQKFVGDPECPAEEKPRSWRVRYVEEMPTGQHAVHRVSWNDAVMFCNWLSRIEGLAPSFKRMAEGTSDDSWQLILDADGYRLPTEAEWELACRAGTETRFCHGDRELLDRYAVFRADETEPTGTKLPNGWGLFDLHGNVWEWCYDYYAPLGSRAALRDPLGPPVGTHRTCRGGSFACFQQHVVSQVRVENQPQRRGLALGFRVARNY